MGRHAKLNRRQRSRWRQLPLRAALACGVSWFVLTAHVQAATVSFEGQDVGSAREVVFTFDEPASAEAKVDGRKLSVTFTSAFAADIGTLANALGGRARLVRQSADQKTIMANLVAGSDVYTRSEGERVTLVLVPAGTAPPQGTTKLTAEPVRVAGEAPEPGQYREDVQTQQRLAAGSTEVQSPDEGVEASELTIVRTDRYARLVFRHPSPVYYEANLSEGRLGLRFRTEEKTRITELSVDPPPMVRSAWSEVEEGWFNVQVQLLPGTGVRHFQEGASTFVDLIPPAANPADIAEAGAEHSDDGEHLEPHGDEHADNHAGDGAGHDNDHDANSPLGVAGKDGQSAPDGNGSEDQSAQGSDYDDIADLGLVKPVVAYTSQGLTLTFPFEDPVPAAIARRNDRVWIAFAGGGDFDVASLSTIAEDGVKSIDTYQTGDALILGLNVEARVLTTMEPSNTDWRITLADSVVNAPSSLNLKREMGDIGGSISINVDGTPKVTRFVDPDIGDEIVFVMLGGPPQGVIAQRDLADVVFLASGHGLAIRPLADGIEVETEAGLVKVIRDGGLHLSESNVAALVRPGLPEVPDASPAFLNFEEWRGPPGSGFKERHDSLMQQISHSQDAGRYLTELELARFLLSYGLYAEALGMMRIAVSDESSLEKEPEFIVSRAVAQLMTGRLVQAKQSLGRKAVPDDQHSRAWRGLLAARQLDWPEARVLLQSADQAIGAYDTEWHARFRLAAARAALELGDLASADAQLASMPGDLEDAYLTSERLLIRGRLADAAGELEKARSFYVDVASSTVEPLAAEAELHRIRMDLREEKIELAVAIDQLEALRFRWRGDGTEVETLITLGEIYARIGEYRHGLNTLRIAVRNFPGTAYQRRASQTMRNTFENLFLNGKADDLQPIQALGLYYDFKELTPVGPKGDLMIRKLSDRLVAMDLLDQATELLDHQVMQRLRGQARSRIAVKLALVQLQNDKPEDAIRTIQKTRLARLPEAISLQRRLVESRALFEIGRHGHALDIISDDNGTAVSRLRADIHWGADDWAAASRAYLLLLDGAPNEEEPLTDQMRQDVMRAAIAYTLAGDVRGRKALRSRFLGEMSKTAEARAFEIITAEDPSRSVEFRTLVEKIASVDTLSAFMDALKSEGPPEDTGNHKLATRNECS